MGISSHLACALLVAGAALMAAEGACAQALDIDGADIEKGEREVRIVNIVNGGWRRAADGEPRSSHELSAAYSPSDWLKAIVHVDVENVIGEGAFADHVGFETLIALRKAEDTRGIALTWYTGLMVSTDGRSTNSRVFGPVLKFAEGPTALTLNTYLEDTFGRNDDPGRNGLYGWQLRHELNDSLALGLEGFGKIENLGSATSWNEQDHRAGPALFLSWDAGHGRRIGLDLGVYAGLTDAAPDITFKLNSGVTFPSQNR